MSYVSQTPNLGLPQWILSEPPQMSDFNGAFSSIDQFAGEKGEPNGLATLDAEGNLVQSHAAGFKLSVAQGGTGASDPVNARSNLGVGKSLWSGNWSSGSITAEELDAYSVYKIAFSEVGTCAIVSKNGSSIRGLGGNAATATTYRQQYFSANTGGNGTWEKVYFCEFNPVSGAQTQTLTVVQIIGIC